MKTRSTSKTKRPGRPSYDTSDPFAYPVSRLAREALQARLESAIVAGRLPVDHDLYLAVLSALFPEDFQTPTPQTPEQRLRRLKAAAFANRLAKV